MTRRPFAVVRDFGGGDCVDIISLHDSYGSAVHALRTGTRPRTQVVLASDQTIGCHTRGSRPYREGVSHPVTSDDYTLLQAFPDTGEIGHYGGHEIGYLCGHPVVRRGDAYAYVHGRGTLRFGYGFADPIAYLQGTEWQIEPAHQADPSRKPDREHGYEPQLEWRGL